MQSFWFHPQKSDSDLIFEDSFGNPLSDDKISNQLNENSRTKLVSKRDSDKPKVDDNQIESDAGWLSRVKRSLSNLFTKENDKVVEKREASPKPVDVKKSPEKLDLLVTDNKPSTRRRRQFEEEEDDDEDNDITSGDHDTTPDPDPVTQLPPVKDDKYCELNFLGIQLFTFVAIDNF